MAKAGERRPGQRPARGPASSRPRRPAARPAPVTPPSRGWRGRLTSARGDRRTVRIAALTTTFFLVLVLLAPTLKAWYEQRSQLSDLRAKVSAQQAEVKDQQELQARWEDKAFVEQQARERLKFVRPGEKSYTVIEPQPKAPELEHMAEGATSADTPWYGTLWSSMAAADAPASGGK